MDEKEWNERARKLARDNARRAMAIRQMRDAARRIEDAPPLDPGDNPEQFLAKKPDSK